MDILLKLWSHVLWSHVHSTVHVSVIVAVLAQGPAVAASHLLLGANSRLGPKLGQVGPFGGQPGAKLGPTRANFAAQCDFDGGSCEAMLQTLGLSWAQLWCQMLPQDQVAHAKPNLRPNVPKLRHVGPPVGLKLGPSLSQLAQVTSCSAQLKAKDGQVWPIRLLVGPSRPASFLSVLFSGCRRFSSRSDEN